MIAYRNILLGAAGALVLVSAANADPVPMPAMSGPLTANPNPTALNLDVPGFGWLFGKVYVTGAVTAMVMGQTAAHQIPGDKDTTEDLANAQVVIQKTDGWFQYYFQAGAYSFPTLGTPYIRAGNADSFYFGALPQGYVKLVLNDSFNIEAGKLPTLIGDEYSYTFENMNVERGLLWNQEPAVSQGAQINYSKGAFSASLSFTDGYYSNRVNWITGLVSYGFNGGADTLAFAGGGNISQTGYARFTSPIPQNNSSIFNLIYTHTSGPWVISPYLQYSDVPKNNAIGIPVGASSFGGAILASYAINDYWKIAGRVEYLSTTGKSTAVNLLYGPGSNAWSFTLTPTWQYKVLFLRPEISYVAASSTTPFLALGPLGQTKDQFRGLVEGGILF